MAGFGSPSLVGHLDAAAPYIGVRGGDVDPFVAQLAHLCTIHPTRAKWVFVPNHAIGRTIGERIALDGTNWLNLRFVTPLDIALRMGAPFLVERGIDPSEEGLGPALMMRLPDLRRRRAATSVLAAQPTMAQALWARSASCGWLGASSGDIKPDAFEAPAKHVEPRALLAAYEQFLATNNAATWRLSTRSGQATDWVRFSPQDC